MHWRTQRTESAYIRPLGHGEQLPERGHTVQAEYLMHEEVQAPRRCARWGDFTPTVFPFAYFYFRWTAPPPRPCAPPCKPSPRGPDSGHPGGAGAVLSQQSHKARETIPRPKSFQVTSKRFPGSPPRFETTLKW